MLSFDGVDDFLEHTSALVTSHPLFMAVLVAAPLNGSGENVCLAQGSTTADAFYTAGFVNFSDNKYCTERTTATGSVRKDRAEAPQISNTVPRWLFVYFGSSTDRRVAFGGSTFTTDTTAVSGTGITAMNRTLVGATRRDSGLLHYAKADIGEAWIGNALPSSTQLDELVAGTRLPENLTGVVDGWYLNAFEAGGTYTSHTGTRTMTASGGVSASGITHPISRGGGGSSTGAAAHYYRNLMGA